jgi:hypothetical protein
MWGASQTDSQLRNKGWSRANMRLMRNMLSVAEVVSFPRLPPALPLLPDDCVAPRSHLAKRERPTCGWVRNGSRRARELGL